MREINNSDVSNIQKTNLTTGKIEKNDPQVCNEGEECGLKDFSNPSGEVLGRSQVNKADNLKQDLAFCAINPEAVQSSDKLFEIAYKKFSEEKDPNAYEKACYVSTSQEARGLLSK